MVNSNEVKIATYNYNLNGAKHKHKLVSVLAQAKSGGIHILFLQEIHHYGDGWHLRAPKVARYQGWEWHHSPASRGDPESGVAIAIRMERKDIVVDSAVVAISGRLIILKVTIGTETASLASIYLNAQLSKRQEEIQLMHASADITPRTILAGDFNCVENVSRDTKSKQGAGPYNNIGGRPLARALAAHGLTDIQITVHPRLSGVYTRCGHQTHTRIDRI